MLIKNRIKYRKSGARFKPSKSIKTCFKSYNWIRSKNISFGRFYIVKLGDKRGLLKICSKERSKLVELEDNDKLKFIKKRMYLKGKQILSLFNYIGFSSKTIKDILWRKPREQESTSSIQLPEPNPSIQSNVNVFICNLCNAVFPDLIPLRNHRIALHFECQYCEKLFKNMNYRNIHVAKSHIFQNPKYQCKICMVPFNSAPELRYHEFHAHNNESYVCCSKCPKAFSSQSSLKSHDKVHLGENIPCSMCPYYFKSIKHWKVHSLLVHRMDYP